MLEDYKDKKVLITGGNGFIGSNLASRLVQEGAKVSIFVREESHLGNLSPILADVMTYSVNYGDYDVIKKHMSFIAPHHIFNLAQPYATDLKSHVDFANQLQEASNLLINLIEASRSYNQNLVSFIHACSPMIYRWSERSYVLGEDTPFGPDTFRGLIKLNQRNICEFYFQQKGFPVRLARIFRAYGPYDHSHKLIIKALDCMRSGTPISLGNSVFKRDYVFIDDLVEGFLLLANATVTNGFEFNFGSGTQYAAVDIVDRIESLTGSKPDKRFDYSKNTYDKGAYLADISKAKKELGWVPNHTLETGLSKTIDWYENFHQCVIRSS